MIYKLALKNLLGSGLRTWLNVFVLSLAFVVMLFYNGMLEGWSRAGERDMIRTEVGAGQYWVEGYDKLDPFSYEDGHAKIPVELDREDLSPLLIREASVYPQGRMQGATLRGLAVDQQAFPDLPTEVLSSPYSILLGRRMAENLKVKEGESLLVRWRDVNGAFDAASFTVAKVFYTDNPPIDLGQIYINLEQLQEMSQLDGECTMLTFAKAKEDVKEVAGWNYYSRDELLSDFYKGVDAERSGAMVTYFFLLIIGLLAIFDTQVLSVFRRTREIGTYIALGMTRRQVMRLFTVEGTMYSLMAVMVGALWGTPLFLMINKSGLDFGKMGADEIGYAMPQVVYPYYSPWIVVFGITTLVIASAIVSYIPARKIARLRPTDAIRGKR